MNLAATLEEIKKLDAADRLFLAHAIWDTLQPGDVPADLSDEQKADLDGRMKELDEHPTIALTWDEMKARRRGRR